MSNTDDPHRAMELGMEIDSLQETIAQSITEEIYQLSKRLNELLPMVINRSSTETDNLEAFVEYCQLKEALSQANDHYVLVHNMRPELIQFFANGTGKTTT
ncbi:MAG: hypothetical protein JWO54_620 [Candidatus Saccharibacteria bacterium]|nr:hypothetical protein [Candidatus Saccharibacteria bacterium]